MLGGARPHVAVDFMLNTEVVADVVPVGAGISGLLVQGGRESEGRRRRGRSRPRTLEALGRGTGAREKSPAERVKARKIKCGRALRCWGPGVRPWNRDDEGCIRRHNSVRRRKRLE